MVGGHIVRATMQGSSSRHRGVGESNDPEMSTILAGIHKDFEHAKPQSNLKVYAGKQAEWHRFWLSEAERMGLPPIGEYPETEQAMETLKRYSITVNACYILLIVS